MLALAMAELVQVAGLLVLHSLVMPFCKEQGLECMA